ncbi:hypothetical protein IQ254_07500 [Nodosilinea sp. LEGE 07088]|nr:hypothetical protein [Nodosilinea sp. LEGE 07088]
MGSQSTAKTLFLLGSMVGWLIVGAAIMYLFPAIADGLVGNDLTHLWMINLARSGYTPSLGWMGGGIALALTVAGNWVWYQHFEGKQR